MSMYTCDICGQLSDVEASPERIEKMRKKGWHIVCDPCYAKKVVGGVGKYG